MTPLDLTEEQQESLMRDALEEAARGLSEGEAPIGCIIARVIGGRVELVARGHNRVRRLQRKTAHAEIVAFESAAGVLPLDATDAVLISTLEPCVMCLGACMESAVSLIVFGLKAPADSGTHRVKPPQSPDTGSPRVRGGVLAADSRRLFERYVRGKEGTPEAAYSEQLLSLTD
jgi:tRNA(adenine34) deaminase